MEYALGDVVGQLGQRLGRPQADAAGQTQPVQDTAAHRVGPRSQVAPHPVESDETYKRAQRAAQGWLMDVPGDPGWQHDLAISHERIGEVQRAQGDLGGALKSLQTRMEISRKLAERDPGNAEWQTDLALSYGKLSPLDTPALPKAERRVLLERGLAVLERLQHRGRLTPDKQTWPDLFRQALQELN